MTLGHTYVCRSLQWHKAPRYGPRVHGDKQRRCALLALDLDLLVDLEYGRPT
jgi:hypothetical protein